MKLLYKIAFVGLVFFASSCSTDLDLLDSPNEVTPDNASVDDLYNNVQINFGNHIQTMWFNTAGMSRMLAQTGAFDYQSATTPNGFNFLWSNAYAGMFPDIGAINDLAAERGLNFHSGASKIMQSIVLTHLVDLFGNVPFSEAGQGTDVISPNAQDGASIYAAANALLDEAIGLLQAGGPTPVNDLVYNGDASKWIKLAKTIKLRNALTTRLVDGSAAGTISSLVAEGDIITSSNDDFVLQYGNTRANPNSRHPRYNNMYEANDGDYMSNYYMWLLRADKLDANGDEIVDPRIRFYFYRKTNDAEGQDVNVYSCHFSNFPDQSAQPAHYAQIDPRLPYCIASADGYFGRDHLNNEGIPPDGPFRTAYGVYPAGGQFDDNSFQNTQNDGTTGGLGAGIEPLMLASFVDFMRAEAALAGLTSEDAAALLESGIRKSITKVFSFASLVPGTMSRQIVDPVTGESRSVADLFVPSAEDVDAYVAYVMDSFANADADGQMDILVKEYYIALWGNGIESYNLWRRTGKPNNMMPSIEPNPGPFIRSFFLPQDHVVRNSTASQKELTQQVFWDGGIDLY